MHKIKTYLYCVFDKYSGNTLYYQNSPNDSKAILNVLQTTRIPLTHSVLLRLGEIELNIPPVDVDSEIKELDFSKVLSYNFYRKPKIVDWSRCKLPENEAEALAPLGLSQSEVSEIVRRTQNNLNLNR